MALSARHNQNEQLFRPLASLAGDRGDAARADGVGEACDRCTVESPTTLGHGGRRHGGADRVGAVTELVVDHWAPAEVSRTGAAGAS
jgi:hypothetical protein